MTNEATPGTPKALAFPADLLAELAQAEGWNKPVVGEEKQRDGVSRPYVLTEYVQRDGWSSGGKFYSLKQWQSQRKQHEADPRDS